VDAKAAGVIEAKKEGVTLSGVETQAARFVKDRSSSMQFPGMPDNKKINKNKYLLKTALSRANVQFATQEASATQAAKKCLFSRRRPSTSSSNARSPL
jgi:hypothetical protein